MQTYPLVIGIKRLECLCELGVVRFRWIQEMCEMGRTCMLFASDGCSVASSWVGDACDVG